MPKRRMTASDVSPPREEDVIDLYSDYSAPKPYPLQPGDDGRWEGLPESDPEIGLTRALFRDWGVRKGNWEKLPAYLKRRIVAGMAALHATRRAVTAAINDNRAHGTRGYIAELADEYLDQITRVWKGSGAKRGSFVREYDRWKRLLEANGELPALEEKVGQARAHARAQPDRVDTLLRGFGEELRLDDGPVAASDLGIGTRETDTTVACRLLARRFGLAEQDVVKGDLNIRRGRYRPRPKKGSKNLGNRSR